MCYCNSGVELGKTIAICVLGSTVIILSLIIAVLLYKIRTQNYKVMLEETAVLTTEQTTRKDYSPQVSNEANMPFEINFDTLKKKTKETGTFLIEDESENTIQHNQINGANYVHELKSHLLKSRQAIIQRDEIHKICENELNKTHQMNSTIHDYKITTLERPSFKIPVSEIVKSSSARQLLEVDEEKDQFPTARPLDKSMCNNTAFKNIEYLKTVQNEESNIKNSFTEKEKHASVSGLLETDEEYDEVPISRPVVEEFYDVVTMPKQIILHDQDTNYLSFITDQREVEPCYINANLNL